MGISLFCNCIVFHSQVCGAHHPLPPTLQVDLLEAQLSQCANDQNGHRDNPDNRNPDPKYCQEGKRPSIGDGRFLVQGFTLHPSC